MSNTNHKDEEEFDAETYQGQLNPELANMLQVGKISSFSLVHKIARCLPFSSLPFSLFSKKQRKLWVMECLKV
jgi:hypothetical protein